MIETLIFYAGVGQLILVIGSLAIPYVLNWAEDTARLRPLTRQVFWTYAGYIWGTNLSFALLSMFDRPVISGNRDHDLYLCLLAGARGHPIHVV